MPDQTPAQLSLRLGPVRSSELFSAHWLRKRLPHEPEWTEYLELATDVLAKLLTRGARNIV
jgi:hypothetical protein